MYVMVISWRLCVTRPCTRCMSYLILNVKTEALDQLLCVKAERVTVKAEEEASGALMFIVRRARPPVQNQPQPQIIKPSGKSVQKNTQKFKTGHASPPLSLLFFSYVMP